MLESSISTFIGVSLMENTSARELSLMSTKRYLFFSLLINLRFFVPKIFDPLCEIKEVLSSYYKSRE